MRHRPLFLLTTLLMTACCGLFAQTALADPIQIFSTGVDNNGNPLAAGATDTHYTIIAGPITGSPLVPVITPAPWTASGAGQWLSVFANANQGAPGGAYTFRTTFDLTGYNPSTAALAHLAHGRQRCPRLSERERHRHHLQQLRRLQHSILRAERLHQWDQHD